VVLYEAGNLYRQLHTDGRQLPKEFDLPAFNGYSAGRWEGDALVVETAGFNDKTIFDLAGHPHSDALHMTERFRRRDFGHLDYETTFNDPKMYTKPLRSRTSFWRTRTSSKCTQKTRRICRTSANDHRRPRQPELPNRRFNRHAQKTNVSCLTALRFAPTLQAAGTDSDKVYAVMRADDLGGLKVILDQGIGANTVDSRQITPLMYAAIVGSADAMRILI
jgi:hypothetical protein